MATTTISVPEMRTLLFTSSFCRFCAPAKNILRSNNIPFREVDVEQETDVSVQYQVRNLPTVITLKGDEEVFRWAGAVSIQCVGKIEEILGTSVSK